MLDAVSSHSFRLASGQMSPAGGSLGLPDEPHSCGGFTIHPQQGRFVRADHLSRGSP